MITLDETKPTPISAPYRKDGINQAPLFAPRIITSTKRRRNSAMKDNALKRNGRCGACRHSSTTIGGTSMAKMTARMACHLLGI